MAEFGVSPITAAGSLQDGEADLAELLGMEDVVRVPHLGRRVSPAQDLRAILSVDRLIRRVRPDIIHTHMAKAGAVGRIAAISAGVPVRVHTFHGHTLEGYFGPALTRGVVAAERALARRTTALLAVSRQVRDDLLAAGIGTKERFRVLEVGLDLSPFRAAGRSTESLRASLRIDAGDPVVGLVGRLVPVKAIDVFLQAVQPLLEARPSLHVVVAGDGPEMARVRAAQHLPGGSRIHALGWITDMAAVYGAIDLMVLSSRNEGTPLSLVEAGAAGIPVVATRVGGVPDIVTEGANGLLVASDSPRELRGAISRVLDDHELSARLGSTGRTMAERFSIQRCARALFDLYSELLQDSPHTSSSQPAAASVGGG